MTSFTFRRLKVEELSAAYEIIWEVTEWLLSKGVRQWLTPIPLDIYHQRQVDGDNYGLFVDDELGAVVSLLDERPDYWSVYLPDTPFKWLATLASARKFKGRGLGQQTIVEAEFHLAVQGCAEIYLDCFYGNGILPQFYDSLGYQLVTRRDLDFPAGTFDSVLMRKRLYPPPNTQVKS